MLVFLNLNLILESLYWNQKSCWRFLIYHLVSIFYFFFRHLFLMSFTNSLFFFLSFVSNSFFAKLIGAEKLKYFLNKSLFMSFDSLSIKAMTLLMNPFWSAKILKLYLVPSAFVQTSSGLSSVSSIFLNSDSNLFVSPFFLLISPIAFSVLLLLIFLSCFNCFFPWSLIACNCS